MADKKRTHRVYARLSDREYEVFKNKYEDVKPKTINSFLLDCIMDGKITSPEEIEELKEMNRHLAEIVRQIKGACNNLNQIAYVANKTGNVDIKEAQKLVQLIKNERMEVEPLWQSTRLLQAMLERKAR